MKADIFEFTEFPFVPSVPAHPATGAAHQSAENILHQAAHNAPQIHFVTFIVPPKLLSFPIIIPLHPAPPPHPPPHPPHF